MPCSLSMCATMREVVVFPFVPVMATIGMRDGTGSGKQHLDHRPGDIARRTFGRLQMHAEPGTRVYFHDSATDFGKRLCDIGRDDVDPGDIEPDDPRGAARDLFILVMHSPVRSIAVPPVDIFAVERK